MEIKEMIKKKKELEEKITALLVDFKEDTTVTPTDIILHKIDVSSMNGHINRSYITHVTVEISL